MKTTYKLLGAFWDGLPEAELNSSKSNSANTSIPCISFQSLLRVQNKENINELLSNVGEIKGVVIEIDYFFLNSNIVMEKFLNKRLKQMVYYLADFGINASVYYVNS